MAVSPFLRFSAISPSFRSKVAPNATYSANPFGSLVNDHVDDRFIAQSLAGGHRVQDA